VTVLPLQRGILYGPIDSRRLGKSLGINLMPRNYKLCSFNCVYCHYGLTDKCTMDLGKYVKDLPQFDDVVRAVEQAAKSSMVFDYLTFSGNGEPTLHPRFADLVDEVVRIRDLHRPRVKVALLSNSTGLVYRSVRDSIPKIDLPVFKLDSGRGGKFKAMNRPAREVHFREVLDRLMSLGNICLQTVLIDGTPSNVGKEELSAYFKHVSRIKPREVHIYSIDRPVPNSKISLISPKELEKIALQGRRETGVEIRAFYVR